LLQVSKFKKLLDEPGIVVAPGAYDIVSAKIIANLNFPAVYIGSYAAQASLLGMPDSSLYSLTEITTLARNTVNAIGDTPLIVDVDHGFGNTITTRRTVTELERTGAAAIHIEDHEFGKHTKLPVRLVSKELMVDKLKAAMEVRKNKDFVIIARTDAPHATGYDDALDRLKAFDNIGVDMVFPAGWDMKKIPDLNKAISAPIFTVARRDMTLKQMEELGVKVVVYFSQALFVAYKAMMDLWLELKRSGSLDAMSDKMCTIQEFDDFIGVPEIEELANKYKIC
jgi:2-methylisocitrate lyase-like PEP mutase family enzyme